jgi:hypothetical protein
MKLKKIKTSAMNFKILPAFFLILIFTNSITGQSVSEKRIFRKSVAVNKEMSLEVNNKYGNIHITNWNTDSVSVRAEVEAFAPNQTRLGKMLEGINVNISETNYLIRAQTDFVQSLNMLFESFKGMTNKLIPYESKVQINYFINVPDYLTLKIENKYGDVYMENNTGDLSLSMSNGSFKANYLNKATEIELTFCDATINRITNGNIDASFSELVIGESKALKIKSISSRFDLKTTDDVDTESRRDKFFIGSVAYLHGNSYFTDFRIEKLKNEINLVTKYGSINADLIEKTFTAITVNSGYTDITLSFDPAVSYNLDIRHINVFLALPEKGAKLEKKSISEEKKEYMTFGTVGNNPGSTKVKIDATRGNIFIK